MTAETKTLQEFIQETPMLRGRTLTTATRLSFFLLLIILFSLTQPLTAQSNEGEAPSPTPYHLLYPY